MEETLLYGGARDTQNKLQKSKNFQLNEVVTSPASVTWIEKKRENWTSYPIRNQDGSGTCVCMTYATEKGILFKNKYGVWMDFSSAFPYQQRKYPETSGCTSEDIYDIFPKIGNVYEQFMPSQNLNDAQVMAVKKESYFNDLAKTYKVMRIALPIDFETVASTIQATGKGVMLWFHMNYKEWTNIPKLSNEAIPLGHSVTCVDFTLVGDKKYLIIQDSWGLAKADKGLRLISEEYFNARCFLASYLKEFQIQDNNTVPDRPKFDGSIISFQKCMKWLGYFPANVAEIESFGNISRSACVKYQIARGILPALGNLGPITRAKLTEEFK
jgi:hypothetical protein